MFLKRVKGFEMESARLYLGYCLLDRLNSDDLEGISKLIATIGEVIKGVAKEQGVDTNTRLSADNTIHVTLDGSADDVRAAFAALLLSEKIFYPIKVYPAFASSSEQRDAEIRGIEIAESVLSSQGYDLIFPEDQLTGYSYTIVRKS